MEYGVFLGTGSPDRVFASQVISSTRIRCVCTVCTLILNASKCLLLQPKEQPLRPPSVLRADKMESISSMKITLLGKQLATAKRARTCRVETRDKAPSMKIITYLAWIWQQKSCKQVFDGCTLQHTRKEKLRRHWKPFPTLIKEKEPLWYQVPYSSSTASHLTTGQDQTRTSNLTISSGLFLPKTLHALLKREWMFQMLHCNSCPQREARSTKLQGACHSSTTTGLAICRHCRLIKLQLTKAGARFLHKQWASSVSITNI